MSIETVAGTALGVALVVLAVIIVVGGTMLIVGNALADQNHEAPGPRETP